MIKNDKQLKHAQARLKEVRREIDELERQYSGLQLDIFRTPLVQEKEKREEEIEEYLQLRELSLEEAVVGPLKKPTLLGNVGELLAKLRIAAGLTQQELAERLDWHQSNLSRFESEYYSGQTVAKIIEYATSLGVWLHITPSLTEGPLQVSYRQESIQGTLRDTTSGFRDVAGIEDTETQVREAEPAVRKGGFVTTSQSIRSEERDLAYA